ncbi:MAG TPA: DinB family protein [Deinococcales bacterium]|nr:DinB family protein [Deinococcales bacterium]
MNDTERTRTLRSALTTGWRAYAPAANILEGLSDGEAETRLPGAPYSIAEIVAHMVFWQDRQAAALETGVFPYDAPHAADGWPSLPWAEASRRFLAGLERLDGLAGSREALDRAFGEDSGESLLLGVALHNAHHLGQVVTLRRLAGSWPPPSGGETW